MSQKLYVQYGAGWCAPLSWINYDASPTLRFERMPIVGKLYIRNKSRFPPNVLYGDILRGLPLPPDSCAAVYASHVLEHLALNDFRLALNNTYKILSPGGIFRLVVPDLEKLCRIYLESDEATAAEEFMLATHLGAIERERGIWGFLKSWVGNSAHLWMWDSKSLMKELSQMGFINIRRSIYGDSEDPMFGDVEEQARFDNAVAIECKKPHT